MGARSNLPSFAVESALGGPGHSGDAEAVRRRRHLRRPQQILPRRANLLLRGRRSRTLRTHGQGTGEKEGMGPSMIKNVEKVRPGTGIREAATRAIKNPGTVTLPSDLT